MKKLYSTENGTHYQYRGYTIFKEKSVDSERKYSYLKGEWSTDNKFGYARTLSLAKLWIDSLIEEEENKKTNATRELTTQEIVHLIESRHSELEECATFWLRQSVAAESKKARKDASEAYDKYVTRVVTVQSILKAIKGGM